MAARTTETDPKKSHLLRKAINETLKARDLPDLDEEEELEEEEAEEIATGNQVDVFDYCHSLVEKGDVVAYNIYKNSSFIARKSHPYSWEKLQAEFGEGHYRVMAKSELSKLILKQQTSFVSAPQEKETKESVVEAVKAAIPPPVDPHDQLAKTAALLKSLQPPVPEDKTGPMVIQFMQTMMQMQQTAQQTTMSMMEKMQENTNRLIERLDNANKEALTRLESKLGFTKPEKSLDALQVLSMLQKAEERGMMNYLRIDELAEKKAAKLAGGDDDKEPESATERLIKTVLPAVTAALQAPKVPVPASVRPQPPRQVRVGRPNPPAPKPQPQAQPQVQPQPKGPSVQVMPKITKEDALEKLTPIVFPKMLAAEPVKADPQAVAATQREAAEEVKRAIGPMGLSISSLLTIVSLGDIIDVATSAGLPQEAHTWLKGFYANLEKLARSSPGQPTPTREPQAPGK